MYTCIYGQFVISSSPTSSAAFTPKLSSSEVDNQDKRNPD